MSRPDTVRPELRPNPEVVEEAMETSSFIERVDQLARAREAPEWGSPHLSVTPTSVAVERLAAEVAALEDVVRDLALELQRLARERESDAPVARSASDESRSYG
jgi:hypothetical protein